MIELGSTGDSGRDASSNSEAKESGESGGLDCLTRQSAAGIEWNSELTLKEHPLRQSRLEGDFLSSVVCVVCPRHADPYLS